MPGKTRAIFRAMMPD